MAINVIGICIVGAILLKLDFPALRKYPNRRDLLMFVTLLTLGLSLSLVKLMNIDIPSPLYLVSWFYRPLSNLIRGLQ